MAPSSTSAALAATAAVVGFAPSQAFVTPGGSAVSAREGKQQSLAASTHAPNSGAASSDASVTSHAGLGLAVLGAAATAVALHRRPAAAAPQAQRSNRQLVSLAAFENELGVQAPVGFWDPLGLSSDGDVAVFKRRRETEIKHGRVSMLATMGYITPELTGKLPGYLSPSAGLKFEDVPNGLAAISKVPAAGWAQIVAYGFFCEYSNGYGENSPAPGDCGFKPPLLATDDPELRTKRLNAEIANGRLSMMAIIGMFFQDGLTGSAWGDWALYTDSPLRAFENELGVQAPVGFWDPLGLSSDGDVSVFKRRRETEIKHGRVSMLATMGYITPELTGKLPGYLSPSAGLKFADVPNGLAAISKVPAAGWAQIVAYGFFCEYSNGYGENSPAPGDCGFKPPLLATDDPELRTKRLNAEIANGRLSMMAIIGMFFQDGLTGSAWGDWALYTDSPLRAFENELGVQAPVGFWDPLGLSSDGDVSIFKRRRETEIKHGRVSMLATMGYITPELTGKLPGYLSPSMGLKFEDVPNGLAAISKVPAAGWAQIVAYGFFCEYSNGYGENSPAPGDCGFKPPLLATDDPELRTKRLNAEIANGRLSMMAIIGMFFQDGLTGSAWGDWALYTDSPLRAFENELGVQAPVGFWDPLGLSSDGDVSIFKRRRETEIKHGRVSMLATMGYITPELTGKLPGYLSPSMGLKFEDVPNGLAAISKVPAAGWAQILAYGFFCEYSNGYGENSPAPGDCGFKPPLLATDDPELRTKRLNAEIANGRLSMMAIIGMFFQDGLTGSAWGDWALYTDSPLRAFEGELGVQPPLGFWDPAGLSADGDVASFTRRRSVEIKHGRICMLATMGYITPEVTGKFPGYLSPGSGLKFADVPNGLAAIGKVPLLGWLQIFGYAFFVEYKAGYDADVARGTPGDYGWKPPLLATDDAEKRKTKLAAELANGRLAMMAIIGMFFQDGLTGSAWGDWALYTDSPLRAFENELGVQAPVGFWDPLGLSSDGDVSIFKRRRETEIKHGRVSMLATMGYITPELTGKLPGYLSPSMGLKFEDVPNGLAAISKVPAAGWAQIVAYGFFCEYSNGYGENSPAPGDCGFKPPLLATDDPELRTKRLNAEIANGRLSMMAIIGMFFQDGLTGSAWGDWALYTDSPLRAFENELGVQAPVGFWDPLGLSSDGDVSIFKRRRETEIKHGRVSMLATMGYITPELTGKLPGYLSPSMGLKFEDVPNGLAAISKVPAAGWAQIVAYGFFCEYSNGYGENSPAPGDCGFKPPLLATDDAALKTKRLNAELANGRLSMMAIIGMFFQDGLTGSAWGDWALYTDSPLRAVEDGA